MSATYLSFTGWYREAHPVAKAILLQLWHEADELAWSELGPGISDALGRQRILRVEKITRLAEHQRLEIVDLPHKVEGVDAFAVLRPDIPDAALVVVWSHPGRWSEAAVLQWPPVPEAPAGIAGACCHPLFGFESPENEGAEE